MPRWLTAVADHVEKIIWDDVPGSSVTVVVQAYGFTKIQSEQVIAVAWHYGRCRFFGLTRSSP